MAVKTKRVVVLPSSSGLAWSDDAMLRECLAGLQPLLDKQALLGGNELTRLHSLLRRLTNRLAPEAPETLATEARAFVEQFGHVPEQSKLQEQKREAEIAEAHAVRERAFAAHRERIAALNEKERQRKLEMVERHNAKAAVDEVL